MVSWYQIRPDSDSAWICWIWDCDGSRPGFFVVKNIVSVSNTIFQYDWVNCDQAWRVTNATSEQFKAGIVRARHAVCWIWERLNLGPSPWVECNVRQQLGVACNDLFNILIVVSNSINMNVRTCIIICSESNKTKEHKLKLRDSFWHDKASGRQWGRLRCTIQYNLRHH